VYIATSAGTGSAAWGVELLDTVLMDGVFVTKDALGRFADIASLEAEQKAAGWCIYICKCVYLQTAKIHICKYIHI